MTNFLPGTTSGILPKNYRHIDYNAIQMNWTRWHAGAVFGLAGGFLIGFSGLFLMVAAYFAGSPGEGSMATWLIISAVPLLWCGAHSLDKIDFEDKAQRLERCRKFEFTDQPCRYKQTGKSDKESQI